jgi:hypothetical protein
MGETIAALEVAEDLEKKWKNSRFSGQEGSAASI